jgi:sec-independent protein translocase protein TatA
MGVLVAELATVLPVGAVIDRPTIWPCPLCYTATVVSSQEALMFKLGVPELLIIAVLVLFMFGGKRLPEMGKGIGEGIKNFKKSIKGGDE